MGSLVTSLMLLLLTAPSACAHPDIVNSHDRYITVRLENASQPNVLRLSIAYRLEVSELTALLDMRDYNDQIDPGLFARKGLEYYGHYARIYSDIIGRNLRIKVNGEVLPLKPGERRQTLTDDSTGKPLGYLRCTFLFSVEFSVKEHAENVVEVRETNFRDIDGEQGEIYFFFIPQAGIGIREQVVPDARLNKLHFLERPSDFDTKIRTLTVRLAALGTDAAGIDDGAAALEHEKQSDAKHAEHEDHDVFLRTYRRLRESNAGIWLILLVFAGLGAAHALTPGHGKTLVAAYLVGENGTIWHAVVLGIVTTITHTGAVLIIAFVLFFSEGARQAIQAGLGLILGLSVTCLGFWLLLQRLSGRADHIHLGGGHDHHHHHDAPKEASGTAKPVGMWGIIIMGMNGGLIPCWDAVAILATVAGTSEFWLALPALLAFSAGLAGVLVAIGIMVVQFRNFASSKWGEGRIVRLLPLLSAVVVTCMGLYLCYTSVPRDMRVGKEKMTITPEQLAGYLEDALSETETAQVEQALRQSDELRGQLRVLIGARDRGEHSLGAVWRRHRLSCPSREQLGSYLLGVLDADFQDFIDFHLKTIGCAYCLANLADLQSQQQESAAQSQGRRQRFFDSSMGLLGKNP